MRTTLALAAFVVLAATPALAVDAARIEARYTPAFERCLESPDGQSTAGMVQCAGAELEIQDRALNAAYRDLTSDMNARQKANLVKAQRAWIAFRDADCQARYDSDWGTLSTITANMCMLRRTVERTIELEEFIED